MVGGREARPCTQQCSVGPESLTDSIRATSSLSEMDVQSSPSSGTLESEPKKDPVIDEDILVPGISGFTEVRKRHTFELNFSQYITIIEESYKAVTTCDPDLKELVPFSAYQYYMVIALWRRLYQMVPPRHGLSTYEGMTEVLPEMPLPKEVRLYLEAVGNITDEEHRTWHLYFDPDIFTDDEHGSAQGSFGRVDEKTYIRYKTMPAPIVALLAMKEDIDSSKDGYSWQLPEDMTSDAYSKHCSIYPTANLLGYRRSRKLTEDQRTMFKDNGIVVSGGSYHFDVINVDHIPIAQRLITFLAGQFRSAKCAMEVFNSTSTNGSLAQVPFTTWVPDPLNPSGSGEGRAVAYSGITCSYRKMSPHVACAAAVFRFRFKRLTKQCNTNILSNTAAGLFSSQIPPARTENEDEVFNKAPVHWNQDYFNTGAQNGRTLAAQLVRNTHKQHKE